MFKNGTLLASYRGAAPQWQAITIEFPPSGAQPEGRYVLLQQNRTQVLEVVEFSASFDGTMKKRVIFLYQPVIWNTSAYAMRMIRIAKAKKSWHLTFDI